MTPFLYLAAAALFLLLAVGLTFPTLRWSYKYDMWRGIVASLGFLTLAPAALVIWYFCMLLSVLFTDGWHVIRSELIISFLLSFLPGILPFANIAVKGKKSGIKPQFLTGCYGLAANISFFVFVLLFMCYGCQVG
jgi:hypothetical protein